MFEKITNLPKISSILLLLLTASSTASPASAQAFMEFGGVQAGAAGLGAGLAASQNHGAAVRSTYEVAVQAQQALVAQNKAIEQYLAQGIKYETKKDYASAEKCFTYVLQVVNRRDGPGSAGGIPALRHLVAIKIAQNKIDDAIGFQKTVTAFTQTVKNANPQTLLKSKMDLSNLFLLKEDYANAEPVLQQSAAMVQDNKAFADDQRRITLRAYSRVLHKLKKDGEASAVDTQLAKYELPVIIAEPSAGTPSAAVPGAVSSTTSSTVSSTADPVAPSNPISNVPLDQRKVTTPNSIPVKLEDSAGTKASAEIK